MMSDSAILDMLIVLALTYMVVAAFAGVIIEAVARAFALRAAGLQKIVGGQFGDPQIERFAFSLLRAVCDRGGSVATERSLLAVIRRQKSSPSGAPPADLAEAAIALHVAGSSIPIPDQPGLATQIERRFAAASQEMRASYRKWTLLAGFVVSFATAAALSLDTFTIAQRSWAKANMPHLTAQEVDSLTPPDLLGLLDTLRGKSCREATVLAVETKALHLATGLFPCSPANPTTLLGLALTALFSSLGAKFWYDILAKLFGYRAGLSSK